MKSDIRWSVVTVHGHELEVRLQQLTDDGFEIVSVDRSDALWTIIAHTAKRPEIKGKTIGFQPPDR